MKLVFSLTLVTCSFAAVLAPALAADSAKIAAPATKPTTSAAWRPLFNGKDLDRLEGRGQGRVEGRGRRDPRQAVRRRGARGLLATNDKFSDFELELEFMIDEHGKYNSGVYLRNDTGTAGRTGYQVNIGRGAAEEYCAGVYTDHWLAKGDEKDTIRKPSEWNTMHIVARAAADLVVDLNGVNAST